jgi:putative transposase
MLRVVHDADARPEVDPLEQAEAAPVDLDELCRLAARDMIAVALEAERRAYLEAHADELDAAGRRLVVGNGYAREADRE